MTRNDHVVVYRTPWRAGAFEPRGEKRGRGAACPHALPSARAPSPSEMKSNRFGIGIAVWGTSDAFGHGMETSALGFASASESAFRPPGRSSFGTSDFRPAEAGGPASAFDKEMPRRSGALLGDQAASACWLMALLAISVRASSVAFSSSSVSSRSDTASSRPSSSAQAMSVP